MATSLWISKLDLAFFDILFAGVIVPSWLKRLERSKFGESGKSSVVFIVCPLRKASSAAFFFAKNRAFSSSAAFFSSSAAFFSSAFRASSTAFASSATFFTSANRASSAALASSAAFFSATSRASSSKRAASSAFFSALSIASCNSFCFANLTSLAAYIVAFAALGLELGRELKTDSGDGTADFSQALFECFFCAAILASFGSLASSAAFFSAANRASSAAFFSAIFLAIATF